MWTRIVFLQKDGQVILKSEVERTPHLLSCFQAPGYNRKPLMYMSGNTVPEGYSTISPQILTSLSECVFISLNLNPTAYLLNGFKEIKD